MGKASRSSSGNDSAKNMVSIIMPLFNHAPYVGQTIESILAQTYENWELIIIDDGSSDGSGAIAKGYANNNAKGDKRIKYHYQKNQGVAMARNAGLAKARGEYVAWQDADDYSHPLRLATQVTFLQQHRAVGAVGTWLQPVDAMGKAMGAPDQLAMARPNKTHADKTKYLIGGGQYGYANLPSFMVAMKWVKAIRGFRNLRVGEDMDFIFRAEEKTNVATIAQPLYYYRHHGNNSEARLSKSKSKRLEITLGNLVYFLSAYGRRIYGRDPIGHLPFGTPLARIGHLRYFVFCLRLYRFVPAVLRLNKMSLVELLVRLLLNAVSNSFRFFKQQ